MAQRSNLIDALERSFKKLKSSVYFDKTQLIQRNALVEYECSMHLPDRFKEIAGLLQSSENDWNEYEKELLDSIDFITFPKSLKPVKTEGIVFNDTIKPVVVRKVQNMLDAKVEVQLLGVLWILTLGKELDESFYQHSYGNRLKKQLFNEETRQTTFSPYLFKPYFEQYESWRNHGLEVAEQCIDRKKDVVVLTMDLTSFFYSVDLQENHFVDFYKNYKQCRETALKQNGKDAIPLNVVERLNLLVYKVLETYSKQLLYKSEGRNILPIGYLPSNILSNWYLNKFDKAIMDQLNPLYYGRYVDDIIIVEKVEKNSGLVELADQGSLMQEDVIEQLLCNCSANRTISCDVQKSVLGVQKKEEKDGKTETTYAINSQTLPTGGKPNITVQNKKVKVFYFKAGCSKALLTSFRNAINANKSEFRLLPEEEISLFQSNYDEIFDIKREDGASVNKLRELNDVELNKFNLSKFLGKTARIAPLINDSHESVFEQDLLKIFDVATLIDFHIFWERMLQNFLLNENFEQAIQLMKKIMVACSEVTLEAENVLEKSEEHRMKKTLCRHLQSSLVRTIALMHSKKVESFIKNIHMFAEVVLSENDGEILFNEYDFNQLRQKYCVTRMVNKATMPSLIDAVIQQVKTFKNKNKAVNLSKFSDYVSLLAEAAKASDSDYRYYPYMITLQDIEMLCYLKKIYVKNNADVPLELHQLAEIKPLYLKYNYPNIKENIPAFFEYVEERYFHAAMAFNEYRGHYVTNASTGEKKQTYSIAIANAKLDESDFQAVLNEEPNRQSKKYQKMSSIVNQAIKEHVDVLIMPESYVPLEWLSLLAQRAAKNQMVVITGVEHVLVNDQVLNLTATILPYAVEENVFAAHITLKNKVHYSPEERFLIEDRKLQVTEGTSYDLFCWNDLWFSVYCCFELASIQDRSLFANYMDALFAVEWNRDTGYYSNIIESLSRDLHCYCAQVNTSDYGDSRIVSPSKSVAKDIVRTKGGRNDTVLTAEIDVKSLRAFQRNGYTLQKEDKNFKPTPPNFDANILKKKINGTLFNEFTIID